MIDKPQENFNIPVGPEAVAETWRARSRLNVSCHASLVWRRGVPIRKIALLTRVNDKGSHFTSYVLHQTLKTAKRIGVVKERDWVCFWADGAPHYRSTQTISNVAIHFSANESVNTEHKTGEAYHMKGVVDGYFGELERRLRRAAKRRIIATVEGLHTALCEGMGENETIEIFVPTISRTQWIKDHVPVRGSTLPNPIKKTHVYKFKNKDYRRDSMIGNDKKTVTGITVISPKLDNICKHSSTYLGRV